MRYVRRRNKFLAEMLALECDFCNCDIKRRDEVYCDNCADHSDCIDQDEGEVFDMAVLRERARDLKSAMDEARRANLYGAASRIEGALRELYPDWPGLVTP